jgi:hypothetical protein
VYEYAGILAFRRDDPRHTELLLAELPHVPRIERSFWVCKQLEVALFEGLLGRLAEMTGLRRGRPTMSMTAAKAEIDGHFWDRYRRYLQDVKSMPPQMVSHLDEATDRVLAMLESPGHDGIWQRRGLVVGQVQSGAAR